MGSRFLAHLSLGLKTIRSNWQYVLLFCSLGVAGAAGALATTAFAAGSNPPPDKTVTYAVTGQQGPPGPPGPPGTGTSCPDGYTYEVVVLVNHPGGHIDIASCVSDQSNP